MCAKRKHFKFITRMLRKKFTRTIRNHPQLRKYTVSVIALLSLIFVILSLDITDSILMGENVSEPYYIDEMLTLQTLRDDVTDCLTKFVRKEGIEAAAGKEATVSYKGRVNGETKDLKFDPTIFAVLTSFNNLLSYLGIKAVIIEPSVLYCMLLPDYQQLLLKRNFNISKFSISKNIVTYGIMEHDVPILQNEGNIYKFNAVDFQAHFVQVPLEDWMQVQTTRFGFETFPNHIFYKHKLFTIHIVVFHERGGYYWHAALHTENNPRVSSKDELLFVDHNSAYERFAFVPLENKVLPVSDFYVPSSAHHFLFEMPTSRFLECDFSRAANTVSSTHPKSHPGMSVNRFNRRTRIVLRELKTIFHPLLMNFWIWSGTMLGWYRQCDIIPYTTDVDFAAWASEVEDLDVIVNFLLTNKHASVKQRYGVLEEALEFQIECHSLRTDVFFVYPIKNGTWYPGHSPKLGYYFRYFFPNFTLCSAELLGEKVQVPCETEKVIEAEYGTGWSKPVSSWSYETSSKGRGPNIYWDEKMLDKVYQVY